MSFTSGLSNSSGCVDWMNDVGPVHMLDQVHGPPLPTRSRTCSSCSRIHTACSSCSEGKTCCWGRWHGSKSSQKGGCRWHSLAGAGTAYSLDSRMAEAGFVLHVAPIPARLHCLWLLFCLFWDLHHTWCHSSWWTQGKQGCVDTDFIHLPAPLGHVPWSHGSCNRPRPLVTMPPNSLAHQCLWKVESTAQWTRLNEAR